MYWLETFISYQFGVYTVQIYSYIDLARSQKLSRSKQNEDFDFEVKNGFKAVFTQTFILILCVHAEAVFDPALYIQTVKKCTLTLQISTITLLL